jgi:hypothetical protein
MPSSTHLHYPASKRVLMIAYHFPPAKGSSGIQRTLSFCKYLPQHGWQPLVLSAHPRAYEQTSNDQLADIPDDVPICRPFALDTGRHIGVRGRYPRILALPDRWVSWWLSALPAGLAMIRRYRPHVIWCTYPIATAPLIALTLQRITQLPLICDFRDQMVEIGQYPADPTVRKVYSWIEHHAVNRAIRVVLTAPGTETLYRKRYRDLPENRWILIENGYDEEKFPKDVEDAPLPGSGGKPLRIVHSGTVYPSERDPTALFDALAILKRQCRVCAPDLRITLRATGADPFHARLIREREIGDLVRLEPPVAYDEALAEMLTADGLLVLQAANCNHQIPAKIYEYLRAQRPILALTDPAGDTATVLHSAGIRHIAPLDSVHAIQRVLLEFINSVRSKHPTIPAKIVVQRASRRYRTQELASALDEASRYATLIQ